MSSLGSVLGGLKAGSVSSLWFAGSVSVFNVLVLLSFKSSTLSVLATYAQCTVPESCFSTLLFPGIPLYDFVRTLVIAVLFAVTIGMYFDYIPGSSYTRKTLLVSLLMLVVMFFLGLYGLVANELQLAIMVSFEVVGATVYAVIFAQLYRRFTREVEFQSQKTTLMKIMVDRRDLTGRKRTFTVNSTHKIEAVSEGRPFREWLVSGGVSVGEPKEPKTTLRVVGNGLLKAV